MERFQVEARDKTDETVTIDLPFSTKTTQNKNKNSTESTPETIPKSFRILTHDQSSHKEAGVK